MSIHIERLSVRNFGPLRELVLVPGNFTVIHGANEAGKTSTIDALVRGLRERVRPGNKKMLDGTRDGPGFNGEVELLLSPEDGEPLITLLREHPSLTRLFVVRDADPSLEGGRGWLTAIRDRLIGIDLERVDKRIRSAASLTPTGALRESRADERQRLAERLARLEGWIAGLPQVARLGEEMHQIDRQRIAARGRIEKLRLAERYERYRAARKTFLQIEAVTTRLTDLERYGEADLQRWHEAVGAVREAAALAKGADNEAHRLRDDLTLAREEERKRELAGERTDRLVSEASRADLEGLVSRARVARGAARLWTTWRTPLAIAATLLLLVAVGLGFLAVDPAATEGLFLLLIGAGAVAAAGLASGGAALIASSRISNAAAFEEQALARCGTILSRSTTLDDCFEQISALAGAAGRTSAEREGAAAHRRGIEQSLESAERLLGERNRQLDETQRRIAEVRERVKLSSLEELEEKLRAKIRAQSQLEETHRTLLTLLTTADAELPLDRQIEQLATEDPGLPPNPAELTVLERELEAWDIRVGDLRVEIKERREHGLATLGLDDLGAAEAEHEALTTALDKIDNETRGAALCLQALRELQQDFDRPLRDALGSSPHAAGNYLARMTDGRYRAAVLDGEGALEVTRADGSTLPVASLSRGTRDQLSLAIRLALARRLLGEPGFLVFDDAFLTSDPERRDSLTQALVEFAAEGWQIIYLTFDSQLRDRLAGLGASVVQLPGRPS